MTHQQTKTHLTNARLLAIQAVYAHTLSDVAWTQVVKYFMQGKMGGIALQDQEKSESYVALPAADMPLFESLSQAFSGHRGVIEETIKSTLSPSIPYARLEPLLLCILRIGIAEFYANPQLDAPIIINEYVDITRSFYAGDEVRVVNAVLDKVARGLRQPDTSAPSDSPGKE